MSKQLVKPSPVAPERVKRSTPTQVKEKPASKPINKPQADPINKREKSAIEKKRELAEEMYPTPDEQSPTNDRGPTQLTISRRIRNRFRKACFLADVTMSDQIEDMMDEYATEAGF